MISATATGYGRSRSFLLGAVCIALAGISACGNRAASPADAGADGGQCSRPAAFSPPAYESVGSGIILGVDVSASVCNVGVALYDSAGSAPDQFLVRLNYDGLSLFDFQRPAGATAGVLQGLISVPAPAPGTYSSTDAPNPCGILSFGYQLPVGPDASVLDLGFTAAAPLNCVGSNPPAKGSWTLQLTSVDQYQGDAGSQSTIYLAHGQLTASLVGAGPGDTVTFALAF